MIIQTILSRLGLTTQQAYKLATLSLCGFVFVLTSHIILSMSLPLGSDAYFHLGLARHYGQGNITAAIDMMFTVNKSPYPFLYHLLLSPIAVSPDPYTGLRILEMLFLPMTFALVSWVTWKLISPKAAFITGLVLMGSWSFLDGAIQARPESLDLLLYPLIIYLAVVGGKRWFGTLAAITIYSHGFAALTNIMGVAIKKFFEKEKHTAYEEPTSLTNTWLREVKDILHPIYPWRKTIIITTLIVAPIIIMSLYYFSGAFEMWSTFKPLENPQEALFWEYPPWIPYYAGITLMGVAFVFRKGKSELETLLKWSLFGNLIMLPFWADRWLQYSAIPLAMLTGIGISRWHGKKLYIVLFAIALGSWIYMSNFILISLYQNWWQPGHFWNMPPPT